MKRVGWGLFFIASLAYGASWKQITNTHERGLFVDMASVRPTESGKREFITRLFVERAYRPPGAIEPIAVSETLYEIDCRRTRWLEKTTNYLTDEGKDAGHAPLAAHIWRNIDPGSEMDAIYRKIC